MLNHSFNWRESIPNHERQAQTRVHESRPIKIILLLCMFSLYSSMHDRNELKQEHTQDMCYVSSAQFPQKLHPYWTVSHHTTQVHCRCSNAGSSESESLTFIQPVTDLRTVNVCLFINCNNNLSLKLSILWLPRTDIKARIKKNVGIGR